jgi:hypothetical protein
VVAVNDNSNGLVLYAAVSAKEDEQLAPAQILRVQEGVSAVFPAYALMLYVAPEQTEIVWSIIAEALFVMVQALSHVSYFLYLD